MYADEAALIIKRAKDCRMLVGDQLVTPPNVDDLEDDDWLSILKCASEVLQAGEVLGLNIRA